MGGVLLLVVLLIVVLVRHRRKKWNQAVYNMRRAEAGYHFEGIKEAEMEAPKEPPVEDEGLGTVAKILFGHGSSRIRGRPSMPLRARLGGKTRYRLKYSEEIRWSIIWKFAGWRCSGCHCRH